MGEYGRGSDIIRCVVLESSLVTAWRINYSKTGRRKQTSCESVSKFHEDGISEEYGV